MIVGSSSGFYIYFLVCLADLLLVLLLEDPLSLAEAFLEDFCDFELPLETAVFGFLQYFSSSESKKPPNCSSLDCCLALIKAFRLSSSSSGIHARVHTCMNTCMWTYMIMCI